MNRPTDLFPPKLAGEQIATVEALAVIVREAAKADLPALSWRVDALGSSLVGTADMYVGKGFDAAGRFVPGHDPAPTRELRQNAFAGYVALLRQLAQRSIDRFGDSESYPTRVQDWPERTGGDGVVRLVAGVEHVTIPLGRERRRWLLSVVVRADLEPDPED